MNHVSTLINAVMFHKWGFYIAITLSVVFNIPDLFAVIGNHSAWVPVNAPPDAVGDEYHYYSIINIIANGPRPMTPVDFGGNILALEFVRILAYYINYIPYALGNTFFDLRFGILFVRLFDFVIVYVSVYFFLYVLLKDNRLNINSIWVANFIAIAVMLLFPPLRNAFLQPNILKAGYVFLKQLGYIFDPALIYRYSVISDLTRAIYSSTSGPLLLLSLLYLIKFFENTVRSYSHVILFIIVNAFVHFPSALALALVAIAEALYEGYVIKNKLALCRSLLFSGIVVVGMVALLIIQQKILAGSEAGREMFQITYSIDFGSISAFAVIPVLLSFWLFNKEVNKRVFIVYLVLALFQFFAAIGGYHGSRLWVRGAQIPYLIMTIYFLGLFIVQRIPSRSAPRIITVCSLCMVIMIAGFIFINSAYLYSHYERISVIPDTLRYLQQNPDKGNQIVTNSIHVSYYVPLYTTKTILLKNYSLQSNGYQEHTKQVVRNFILLGLSEDEVLSIFQEQANIPDWFSDRENLHRNPLKLYKAYCYGIAFNATYKDYNYKIKSDDMMSQTGDFTLAYYALIKNAYSQAVKEIMASKNEYEIIIDKQTFYNTGERIKQRYTYSEILNFDDGRIVVFKNAKLKQ